MSPTSSIKRAVGVLLAVGLLLSVAACSPSKPKSATSTPFKSGAGQKAAPPPSGAVPTPPPPGGNIYANDAPNEMSPKTLGERPLVYVPESQSSFVDVIDPISFKVVDRYQTGYDPQHVIPSWDLQTLYAGNDLGNSLTPISPYTGKASGPNIPVDDPYNMYFTTDGKYAIVVEETKQTLAFRDPHTMALVKELHVDCAGVDHADFSPDGAFAIFSCEFSGKMVKVNMTNLSVAGYLNMPGSSPQDVKLDPAGKTFYIADRNRGGVYLVDAGNFTVTGFVPTGKDCHGLYLSRDDRFMYVSNRGSGSVSVIDVATQKVVKVWTIPGGGSPDMGGVSADGGELWLSGRYNACVYVFSTLTGQVLAQIKVQNKPHGLAVWPQPGNYSLGHTGIMR